MARAIDAERLINELKAYRQQYFGYGWHNEYAVLGQCLSLIDAQPTLTLPNEPLTLDELREMDGEPVWVIYDQDAAKTTPGFDPLTFWALVEVAKNSVFLANNFGGRTAYADDQDLDWEGITVYRRPPEGNDDA